MPVPNLGATRHPIYIGIDPGQHGGLVTIGSTGVTAIPMPETERDVWDWIIAHRKYGLGIHAVIERVHSMPKQGVASSFKFGQGYGSLRMALIAAGISFDDVPPQQWMKALGIPSIKSETRSHHKERLRAKAQQLFPQLPIWKEPKSKGRQLAIADALLIALFCQRKHEGKL